MSANSAFILTGCAWIAVMATWGPAVWMLGEAAMGMCRRRPQALWPLAALIALGILTVSAAITAVIFMMLGTEMIGGPDRPTICVGTDELGMCRPTVDRSGPATPRAVHAVHVLAAMAVVGLVTDAVLLVSRRWIAPTLTRGVGDLLAASGGTPSAEDPETQSVSATPLLGHNDRNTSHE
ncbi:hypothetical protein [Rhodococcus sp. NPDC006774]|uniref:hypothetical protein n=1 Tax=Rhodococcus sp. NPDC006774 TaxID=3157186 RepID=UPI0034072A77